jgi:undecaprenyl-diphosphatase
VYLIAAASHVSIYRLSFLQAIVLGLIQGFFELFPLSSLGHTVLIPSWFGGNWSLLVRQESLSESPYLAFIVGLHLANALALFIFYLREWGRLIAGFFQSIGQRRIETDSQRLAWLIVIATIPVGIFGLVFEHTFRTLFAKPVAAAIFLTVNGLILFTGEWFRRRNLRREAAAGVPEGRGTMGAAPAQSSSAPSSPVPSSSVQSSSAPSPSAAPGTASVSGEAANRDLVAGPARRQGGGLFKRFKEERLVAMDDVTERDLNSRLSPWSALWIGASQSLALFAGISREGVTMVGGLYRGLSNEGALRFAFLLSAPVIFAAGALKVPDLLGHLGNGLRGQVIAGSAAAVVASFASIIFLSRYFKTRTLIPFAVYSVVFGLASVIRFGAF